MSAQPGRESATLTFEEFLRFEAAYRGDERFELTDGTVVMMAGGSERHDLTVLAIFRRLDAALSGGPCRVFIHNRKLKTSERDSWYPDILVRCGAAADRLFETDARFIVEVLFPGNGARDRTRRLYAYQSVRSIEAIAFVDLARRVVTVHERTPEGFWGERELVEGHIRLGGADLNLTQVWTEVDRAVTAD